MLVLLLERDKVDRALELAAAGAGCGPAPQAGPAAFQWAQEALHYTAAAN
jgi:EAL and modified HD-GYP domain-containing signal transduction protein